MATPQCSRPGQLPYPMHRCFGELAHGPNPPILLSRFRIMPHSSSSVFGDSRGLRKAAEKARGRGYSGRRHRNSGLVSTRRRLARNATRHERPTPPRPSREAQARGLAWSCRIVLLSPDPRSTLVRTRSASSSTTMILRSPEGVLDRGPPRGAPRRLAGTPALRLSLIELALNQVTRIEKRFIRRSRCRNG